MAVDLKIEAFSVKLFQHLCYLQFQTPEMHFQTKTIDAPEISYGMLFAVKVRHDLSLNYLAKNVQPNFDAQTRSGTDMYIFIQNAIPVHCLLPGLIVFDKMFSIYSFCFLIARICQATNNDIYINTLPLCCAMYIDTELKDEFYSAGGWIELKRYASTYPNPYLFDYCYFQIDVENAVCLLMEVCREYNWISIANYILDQFSKREEEGRIGKVCYKCILLHKAFFALKFPKDYDASNRKYVEGIIQVILCRPLPVPYTSEAQNQKSNDISSDSSNQLIDSENSNGSRFQNDLDVKISEILKEVQNKSSLSSRVNSKGNPTREFLFNLFGDFDDEQVQIKPGSCTFCKRIISQSPQKNSLDEGKFMKEEIMNAIKLSHSTISNPEHNATLAEKGKELLELASTPNNKSLKMQNTSESKHSRDSALEKNIVSLFTALGIEPVKSLILSDINTETVFKSKVECDAQQITSENKSYIKKRKPRRKSKMSKKD